MTGPVRTAGIAERIEHPALAAAAGRELGEATCTDRAKLGVVLQGAALLSLCEAAGWSLQDGWRAARVDERGLLNGLAARPGRDRISVQSRLQALVLLLFRARGRVAGRGEARRAARELNDAWGNALVPMSSDDAVGVLFDVAPFLWEPEFEASRATLRGGFARGEEWTRWIAGPPAVRQTLAGHPAGSSPTRSPSALAAAGKWSEAVRGWQESPPQDEVERRALAESLYALGRFEAALLLVADHDDNAALALRAGCRLLLGELGAAREAVERLTVRELALEERLEYGDVALRILAIVGDGDGESDWAARALAAARSREDRSRAHLLAATAAMDTGDLAGAKRHFAQAHARGEDGAEDWRWHEVGAWLAEERGDGEAIVSHTRTLLALRRRRMRRFEAGRAWNNLGLGYLHLGRLQSAERAFEQSVRLLRRCDGPLAVTLPQSNLVEARLRAGKLLEVEPILRASTAFNRRSGNARGLAVDETLWVRYELVRGQPEAALARAARCHEALERRGFTHQKSELAALAARAAGWLERVEEAARWIELAGAEGEDELEPEELPGWFALGGAFDAARERSRNDRFAALWSAVLRGEAPARSSFASLERLEPFRRARLLLDLELTLPGAVPEGLRAEAAARFRRVGAGCYARMLERGEGGGWAALRAYLESAAKGSRDSRTLRDLFNAIGHPEAELTLAASGGDRTLVSGHGETGEELSAAVAGGTLLLRAARIDDPLRVVFALLRRDPPALDPTPAAGEAHCELVGQSPSLLAALDRLRQFARSEMPVLILGESGTGKELAAREIRRRSARAKGPWVAVNCAALSETLLLSDLFGHVRGAFTGADRPHAGVFETAHHGTVFLDEIGDLPPIAQGNLLRVLQEGEVRRLGETMARKVDVRLVAATHRDLAALVREGKFRQDLYYRLKVCTVTMPPLRDRGDDLELLAESFLETERRRRGLVNLRLTAEARRRLAAHSWPGNVRELAHVLQAAVALAGDGPLGAAALDLESAPDDLAASDYHRDVDDYRRSLLSRALAGSGGNRAAAARKLGISRQALSYLTRRLELDIAD